MDLERVQEFNDIHEKMGPEKQDQIIKNSTNQVWIIKVQLYTVLVL